MASRSSRSSQSGSSGSPSQRRSSREIVEQYGSGKKFKVKYLGSQNMADFASGNAAAVDAIKKIRQESARLKSTKIKATITLQIKGVSVFDEKAKIVSWSVTVPKVKYVCHDHHDMSVFAIVISTEDPVAPFKLYCYQADQKIAMTLVKSMNELFKIVHKMILAKRQAQQAQQEAQQAAQKAKAKEKEKSDDEFSLEDPAVNLGFGIPPPPPSYKAAISKKNSEIFKIPENIQSAPVVLPPPPKSASSSKLPSRQTSQPAAQPQPMPRAQTNPSLQQRPPTSSTRAQGELPMLQPPPISPRTQGNLTGQQPVPKPRRRSSQRTSPEPPVQETQPTQQRIVSTAQRPSVPETQPMQQRVGPSAQRASTQATQQAVIVPPPTAPAVVRAETQRTSSPVQEMTPVNQVRGGPTAPVPAPVNTTGQPGAGGVWEEWRSLEGELQELAQEVGIDMNTVSSTSGQANLSFDDPFADDFFQTSFGSPTNTQTTVSPSRQATSSGDFFASFPTSLSATTTTDSFSSPPVTASGPPATPFDQPSSAVAATTDDPFTVNPATVSTGSVVSTSGDPFIETASTSQASDFVANFASQGQTMTTPFETNFGKNQSSASVQANCGPSPLQSSTTPFEANFPNVQPTASAQANGGPSNPTPFEANFPSLHTRPTPSVQASSAIALQPINTASFETTTQPKPTVATKRGSLIPPPSSKPRTGAGTAGGRPRPRGKGSIGVETLPQPDSTQAANTVPSNTPVPVNNSTASIESSLSFPASTNGHNIVSNGSTLFETSNTPFNSSNGLQNGSTGAVTTASFKPEANSFSASFSSAFDDQSTLQLSNPLYDSQITNTSGLPLEVPGGMSVNAGGPLTTDSIQPSFPVDPSISGALVANAAEAAQPSFPSWDTSAFPPPTQEPPVQQFGYQDDQPIAIPDSNMFQFPGQDVSLPPTVPGMLDYPSPTDSASVMFSPPQNFGDPNAAVDLTNNPFAGDFNSPPFAIHSSTPQSPGHSSNSYHDPQQALSPTHQVSTPVRKTYDGPDVFAALLPLALTPSKESSEESQAPRPLAPAPSTNTDTPKTTQSNPPAPKRPSLNDLYNKRNSFDVLASTEKTSLPVHLEQSELIGFEAGAFPSREDTPSTTQSFDDNFGTTSSTTESTSWIAF